jgi:hypothetical protein
MHRSRLYSVLIDCSEDTFEASVNFWSGATGREPVRPADPTDPYVSFERKPDQLYIDLQKVNDTSRYHLDFETDDVEAEVQRLEKLGATRHTKHEKWWIMRAPGGQLFCVVPIQSDDFAEKAHVWED